MKKLLMVANVMGCMIFCTSNGLASYVSYNPLRQKLSAWIGEESKTDNPQNKQTRIEVSGAPAAIFY